MIKQTQTPIFTVKEEHNKKAHVAEIFIPGLSKPQTRNKKSKTPINNKKLRRTGRKAPDVIMDVYMGVLSQLDPKPKIQVLK